MAPLRRNRVQRLAQPIADDQGAVASTVAADTVVAVGAAAGSAVALGSAVAVAAGATGSAVYWQDTAARVSIARRIRTIIRFIFTSLLM